MEKVYTINKQGLIIFLIIYIAISVFLALAYSIVIWTAMASFIGLGKMLILRENYINKQN